MNLLTLIVIIIWIIFISMFYKVKKIRTLMFGFIFLFSILFFFFIYKGFILRDITIINSLFSPKDFFENLDYKYIDVSKKGNIVELDITNNYPGSYMIALCVSKYTAIGDNYLYEFEFDLNIFEQGKKLLHISSSHANVSSFWGTNLSGIRLFTYEVPYDLPRNKKLKIKISIFKEDNNFNEKYGESMIIIKKMADI